MKPNICYAFVDLRNPEETEGKPDDNPWMQIHCPKCGDRLAITRGQYEGRISMHHDVPHCGYHETWDLRGYVPSTHPPSGCGPAHVAFRRAASTDSPASEAPSSRA